MLARFWVRTGSALSAAISGLLWAVNGPHPSKCKARRQLYQLYLTEICSEFRSEFRSVSETARRYTDPGGL